MACVKLLVDTASGLADERIRIRPRGGEKGEQTAQAISHHAHLAAAHRARRLDRCFYVGNALVAIELAVDIETARHILFIVGVQLPDRLHSPEKIGRTRELADRKSVV